MPPRWRRHHRPLPCPVRSLRLLARVGRIEAASSLPPSPPPRSGQGQGRSPPPADGGARRSGRAHGAARADRPRRAQPGGAHQSKRRGKARAKPATTRAAGAGAQSEPLVPPDKIPHKGRASARRGKGGQARRARRRGEKGRAAAQQDGRHRRRNRGHGDHRARRRAKRAPPPERESSAAAGAANARQRRPRGREPHDDRRATTRNPGRQGDGVRGIRAGGADGELPSTGRGAVSRLRGAARLQRRRQAGRAPHAPRPCRRRAGHLRTRAEQRHQPAGTPQSSERQEARTRAARAHCERRAAERDCAPAAERRSRPERAGSRDRLAASVIDLPGYGWMIPYPLPFMRL